MSRIHEEEYTYIRMIPQKFKKLIKISCIR